MPEIVAFRYRYKDALTWVHSTTEPARHPNLIVEPLCVASSFTVTNELGWQPIETAPKDGSIIDVWHDEFGRQSDCFWGLPEHCCGEYGQYCDSEWHSLEEGWVDSSHNEIFWQNEDIIFWRPLPAPPVETGV